MTQSTTATRPASTSATSSESQITLKHIESIQSSLAPLVNFKGISRPTASLAERMAHYKVPGVSIALIENGQIAWAKSWGVSNVDSAQPVNTETLFQAASMSKPVAALAALRMVDAGDLTLDEPINKYLSRWQIPDNEFTQQQAVTLRHLLSHTAGTTVHGYAGYASKLPQPDGVQVLQGAEPANSEAVTVDTLPGTQFRYSGGGYTAFQVAMEDVKETPFASLLDELVLTPAGMSASTFEQPLPAKLWDNVACGHLGDGSLIKGRFNNYPEQAAAGLWTTPTELAQFYMAVTETFHQKPGSLLSADLAKQLLSDQTNGACRPWGLGFTLYPSEGEVVGFGHGGANGGYRAESMGLLDGRGAVIMTNGDEGGALAQEILATIAADYNWPVRQSVSYDLKPLTDELGTNHSGAYQFEAPDQTYVLNISAEGEGFLMTADGFPETLFYWVKEDEGTLYFLSESGAQFSFTQDDMGEPVLNMQGAPFTKTTP